MGGDKGEGSPARSHRRGRRGGRNRRGNKSKSPETSPDKSKNSSAAAAGSAVRSRLVRLTPLWGEHHEDADEEAQSLSKCAVGQSAYGTGVFATEHIKRGVRVWNVDDAPTQVLTEEVAHRMCARIHDNDELMRSVLDYCYWTTDGSDGKLLVDLRVDVGRFFNHSFLPTVGLGSMTAAMKSAQALGESIDPYSLYALRDIEPGEELTVDFNTYPDEPEWYLDLLSSKGYHPLLLQQVCEQNAVMPPQFLQVMAAAAAADSTIVTIPPPPTTAPTQ